MYGDSEIYTGGECGKDILVKSGDVEPLSKVFPVGLAFPLANFVGSSSWGWVKITLGEEKSLRYFLTSLCIFSILSIFSASYVWFSNLPVKLSLDSD